MKNYEFLISTPNAVVVQDNNSGVSVTNSIERVLSHFEKEHETIGGRRFFYYDSDGSLTEALIERGRFSAFCHPVDIPFELRC